MDAIPPNHLDVVKTARADHCAQAGRVSSRLAALSRIAAIRRRDCSSLTDTDAAHRPDLGSRAGAEVKLSQIGNYKRKNGPFSRDAGLEWGVIKK
ncbi:hypothetical protein [Breoghania sp.]|uniref:hypothetical protein n=1 Tax=Breoghania sp. TaxID=2065378 RepID=UPI0029C9CE22|nr:hypothetical protein [Breoghania sp.]